MLRTLIHMDEPDHKAYRAVAAAWFQPKQLKRMEDRMNELAVRFVDRMAELGTECDFARDIAVHYPLYVILSLLGLPESDFDRMLMLTQQLFGGDDEDLRRSTDMEEQFTVLLDFFNYFTELTASRRATPTEDLASVLANAAHRRRVHPRHGPGVVLRDHCHGGPRHHELHHRRRAARVVAPPRRAGPAAGEPRTAARVRSRR